MGNPDPNDVTPIDATGAYPVLGAAGHGQPGAQAAYEGYAYEGYQAYEQGGFWPRSYGQPEYGMPEYEMPEYEPQEYGVPEYGVPEYPEQGYTQQEYGAPGDGRGGYTGGVHPQAAQDPYARPAQGYAPDPYAGYGAYGGAGAYPGPGYGEAGYREAGYGAPADAAPSFVRPPDPWDDLEPGHVERGRSRRRGVRPSAARLVAALRASAPWSSPPKAFTDPWPAPPRNAPRPSPWLLAAGAIAAVGAVVAIFALGSATQPPAALSGMPSRANATPGMADTGGMSGSGAMSGGTAAMAGYRLIAPASADGMPRDTVFARDLASGKNAMGAQVKHMYGCLGKQLHSAGTGQVTADVIAQYETGDMSGTTAPRGFFFAGYNGVFGPGAALYLVSATACGLTASGDTAALRLPPGPHGGTLYTVGGSQGTECVWSTATTAGMVTFFAGDGGLTVPDPGSACVKVRDAVEVQGM
ncbi:MAG: hypothetical protein JOY82_07790 [Streptosporangiaceae bacterium]|nr:hypothetical protein [Streptosporangiaceae bacterium]MBV9854414.1 hypothetical protein [Streptosporangiaceae bacterium]